jgi:regulator of PEP synthase PpsR (kinase-PPPase family)
VNLHLISDATRETLTTMAKAAATSPVQRLHPHCAGRRNESQRMKANATTAPISSAIPPPK